MIALGSTGKNLTSAKPRARPGLAAAALAVMLGTAVLSTGSLILGTPAKADKDEVNAEVAKIKLPPATGPLNPMSAPVKGDDGLYHHDFFVDSFLDLKEEWKTAKEAGKSLVLFVEQRGCSYCEKIQKEILSLKYINDYVRKNFAVVQLNLWGERKVTDFDGTEVPEKEAARRWGVLFTPTIIFISDDPTDHEGKPASAWEVARMPGAFKKNTFYDMFVWVKSGAYKTVPNFQAFHINRIEAREKMAKDRKAGVKAGTKSAKAGK